MPKTFWNYTPMSTPSTVPDDVPQNSNNSSLCRKRAFPGASSSSHECKEVKVLEVPLSISHRKPSSSKDKEATSHKIIIDIDDDVDDDDNEVMIIDGNAGKSSKGKETLAVGHTSTTIGAYGIDMPKNGYGFSSNDDVECCNKSTSNTSGPSHGSSGFKSSERQNTPSPVASAIKVDQKIMNESLKKYAAFKKFDMVEDFSDHKYAKKRLKRRPPKEWSKRIQEEWKNLKKGLPDTIFVRAYESRMDLLRAVIVGAKGTPYHDGLYFFDVYFPSDYPEEPPEVHYWSGGLRINPNLYDKGKVCLSLLGTWHGQQENEEWIPENSTVLQVLVSIQGLILNAKPYLNEPGYENHFGPEHENVYKYNEEVFTKSLRTMLYNIRRPPKHFEDFVVGHFRKHGRDILVCCKAYMDGAQVVCLVKGGVQDVEEGDKSCSQKFKDHLAALIIDIVNAFSQIGAKDCNEFLSLAQKATGIPEPFFSIFG